MPPPWQIRWNFFNGVFYWIAKTFRLFVFCLSGASSDPRLLRTWLFWNSLRRLKCCISFRYWLEISSEIVHNSLDPPFQQLVCEILPFSWCQIPILKCIQYILLTCLRIGKFQFGLLFSFGVELACVSWSNVPEFDVDCSWLWSTATAVWPVRLFCLLSFFFCFLISFLFGTLVRRFLTCRQTGTSHVRFRSLNRQV